MLESDVDMIRDDAHLVEGQLPACVVVPLCRGVWTQIHGDRAWLQGKRRETVPLGTMTVRMWSVNRSNPSKAELIGAASRSTWWSVPSGKLRFPLRARSNKGGSSDAR